MNESHFSLRDDYEVTGFGSDTLSAEARMTGVGFGACTINYIDFLAKKSR